MADGLGEYIRQRCLELGLTMTELHRQTGLSRQTIHTLGDSGKKLPALQTVVSVARVLQVHPIWLLQLLFEQLPTPVAGRSTKRRGDQSAFVRDVTVPDGAYVLPGQRFVKTWEMQNVGRVRWEGRFLQCMDEEVVVFAKSGEKLKIAQGLVPAVHRISIPTVEPGQTVQLSIEFTAPRSPGTVVSYWKSVFQDGRHCFPNAMGLYVKVSVSTMAAAVNGEG